LQPVAWDEVGGKIWIPTWETYAGNYAKVLAGITPSSLPELSQNLDAFSCHLRDSDGEDLAPEEHRQQAVAILGVAIALALSRNGWELRALPGEDVICEHAETLINPFDIVPKLVSGELTPEAWQEFSVGAGIADLDLGSGTSIT
jgi:hypothetical protein